MSIYTYQTMLIRKFYKFIKFKTVSKCLPRQLGLDSTETRKIQVWVQALDHNVIEILVTINALASLVHACNV